MLQSILQTTILYWTVSLDLLVLLVLLYGSSSHPRHHRAILLGQAAGSAGLVTVSLLLALVFHAVLPEWLLGFLGIVPIYFGLRALLGGEDDDEAAARETLDKRQGKNLAATAALLAFSSCAADNIGLFTPFFATLPLRQLPIVLATFAVNIAIVGLISERLSHLPRVGDTLARYSRWVSSIVYLGLGVMILFEAGTVAKIVGIL